MTGPIAYESNASASGAPRWGAVFALTLCVATLIASEFMPISLLTPIATDLHMTEGRAGQAIAVSGIFAVLTSLVISSATRGIDRRVVLLSLTLLMMASGLMVALTPGPSVFMAGRALIGIVIGGFWSMSAATVMRLVPEAEVPRALGVLNGGNALATTVAAPVGWWTWLSKALPDDAEAGGGLMVAVIQLAIALGATAGGFIYDSSGYRSTFVVSAAVLCASALVALASWRAGRQKLVHVVRDRRTQALGSSPDVVLDC